MAVINFNYANALTIYKEHKEKQLIQTIRYYESKNSNIIINSYVL